jgi:hypothetical protein
MIYFLAEILEGSWLACCVMMLISVTSPALDFNLWQSDM